MRRVVDGRDASPAGIGRIFPYIFGVVRGVLAIPLRTGAQAALREGVTDTDLVFKLQDVESLRTFPDAGTASIEGEVFTWEARDFTEIALTEITRGAESTTPVLHGVGVAIYEIIPEHVYGLFENPGAHLHTRVDAVYVNGILKDPDVVPTHTITMADTAAGHDPVTALPISIGTIRFDMTDPLTATSPFVSPDSLAAYKAFQERQAARYAAFLKQFEGQDMGGGKFYKPPSPKLLPQLGLVTADITGLQDDSSGTITGIANQALTNPAHVTRLILQEGFQQSTTSFLESSWTQAALIAAGYGYRWDMEFLPMAINAFQQAVFEQSRINVFQESGLWRAVFRKPGPSAMTFEADRRVSWAMRWTPLQEVISSLNVTHGVNDDERTLIVTSTRGAALVPAQTGQLTLPWVKAPGMAKNLGEWQLGLRDHPRRHGNAVMSSVALPIIRVDTVAVDSPMLDLYGGTDLLWRVEGTRITDALIDVAVEEEDPFESSPVERHVATVTAGARRVRSGRFRRGDLAAEEAEAARRVTRRRQQIPLAAIPPPDDGDGEHFADDYFAPDYFSADYFG